MTQVLLPLPQEPSRNQEVAEQRCARMVGRASAKDIDCLTRYLTQPQSCGFSYLDFFAHRASAALRAISRRSSGGIPSHRAFPPFFPPFRPSATAWGFFFFAISDHYTSQERHRKIFLTMQDRSCILRVSHRVEVKSEIKRGDGWREV